MEPLTLSVPFTVVEPALKSPAIYVFVPTLRVVSIVVASLNVVVPDTLKLPGSFDGPSTTSNPSCSIC